MPRTSVVSVLEGREATYVGDKGTVANREQVEKGRKRGKHWRYKIQRNSTQRYLRNKIVDNIHTTDGKNRL